MLLLTLISLPFSKFGEICCTSHTLCVHAILAFRLQLYSILKSDWSGTWLLLPMDAMYHGFYCVHGLCCIGTVVGWSQVEGGSHLTAHM